MQPPTFVLNCLGVPRLLTPGGQEVRVKVKKHLAALVVLAVDGGRIRRDRLVSLLWPTARPDRARGSVATAISFLRGKLGGDAIEPGRDWVQLRRGYLTLDLDRLVAGEVVGDDFTPPLDVDAFLAGFEIEQVPEFDDWRERQHARLLPAVEKGLIALADHARRSGDLNGLGRHADRMLQLNDLSEAGIRARMEAYALSGDRITAIRVYDDWTERLRVELRALPSRSVEELANRLRRKGWDQPASESTVAHVQTEQWRNQHFVGRSREFRRLYENWEITTQGSTRHVLLTGDSGVGKTTLADRFATAVAIGGASVARVRCFELERGIPYSMIGGVLESFLDRPGASATSPQALAELSLVLPEMRRRFSSLPQPILSSGESARIRFAESAIEFLEAVAEEHPILVVIDDVDQADEVSLAVLHLLIRRLSSKPIMLVLTTRSGVSARRQELAKLRANSTTLGINTLDIEPLTSDESSSLFAALVAALGISPSAAERRALLSAAAGFPLAVELLVRDWQARGPRSAAIAVRAMTSEVKADPEATYQQLTEKLLADFDDTEQVVVHMAAILDSRVGDIPLYQIADLPTSATLGTLGRLVERRALRDTPRGLEWVNPSVRAHAYIRIPQALRRWLHDAIAVELSRRIDIGEGVERLEVAWHCARAGRQPSAIDHLLKGSSDAIKRGAPHEAEMALSTGMDQLEGEEAAKAALLLAEALQEQSRFRESLTWLSTMATSSAHLAVRARILVANCLSQDEGIPHIEKQLVELASIADSNADPATRALAIRVAASGIERPDQSGVVPILLRSTERLALPLLDVGEQVATLTSIAKLHYSQRRLAQAQEILCKALAIADENGVRSSAYLGAINGLAAVAGARGDYVTGLEFSKRLYALAERWGQDGRRAPACNNAALCSLRLGRYDDAMDWVLRGEMLPRGEPSYSMQLLEVRGVCAALRGRKAEAMQTIHELIESSGSACQEFLRVKALLSAADVSSLLGRNRQACEIAHTAVGNTIPTTIFFPIAGHTARWVSLLAPDVEGSDRVAEWLSSLLDGPLDALDLVEVRLAVARLAGGGDDYSIKEIIRALPPGTSEFLARLGFADLPRGDIPETNLAVVGSASKPSGTLDL